MSMLRYSLRQDTEDEKTRRREDEKARRSKTQLVDARPIEASLVAMFAVPYSSVPRLTGYGSWIDMPTGILDMKNPDSPNSQGSCGGSRMVRGRQ